MRLIELQNEYLQLFIDVLLQDNNTGRNIIWATDDYKKYGDNFSSKSEMTSYNVNCIKIEELQPRVTKSIEAQKGRTKGKAEVFTPSWICDKMNSYCDLDWFNIKKKEQSGKIKFIFDEKKSLESYIDLKKLEITCGEAPFVVSRYDTTTGEEIPTGKRIGFLDRKLMAISQYIKDKEEWLKMVYRAYESTYAYEYQGDNLLKARINLFYTFVEYYEDKWKVFPTNEYLRKISNIISKNIWQMNGLSHTIPMYEEKCSVYNWKNKKSYYISDLEGKKSMKFDYVIGNPPYQADSKNTAWDGQIYNYFVDESYKIGDKVILITPARFLFNAGKTPKDWNEKMLNDEHFKVLYYEPDSKKVFQNTDIMGGVSIHYRDIYKVFGKIKVFNPNEELNEVLKKVKNLKEKTIDSIILPYSSYSFSEYFQKDKSEIVKDLPNKKIIASNLFEKLDNEVFYDDKPSDDLEYIKMYGRKNNERVFVWIRKDYIDTASNFDKFKLFIPAANGCAAVGTVPETSVIGCPIIGEKNVGHNQTFISLGSFETYNEALAALKYLKSKFTRALIGTLKVTQNGKRAVYANVPLQDFTENSDIDWSKSISEIDQQLYKKYGLDEKEIIFIEEKIKGME